MIAHESSSFVLDSDDSLAGVLDLLGLATGQAVRREPLALGNPSDNRMASLRSGSPQIILYETQTIPNAFGICLPIGLYFGLFSPGL